MFTSKSYDTFHHTQSIGYKNLKMAPFPGHGKIAILKPRIIGRYRRRNTFSLKEDANSPATTGLLFGFGVGRSTAAAFTASIALLRPNGQKLDGCD